MTPGWLPAAERAVKRLLGGRAVRWGFAALAVGLGGYAIAKQWGDIEHALGRIGLPISIAAMIAVLGALFASMKSWQVLLAGLGSPLPVPVASRVVFLGQLGKYLPGSVWPILAQMELGTTYRVPRHRSASVAVLAMLLSLLTGLLIAAVTLPFAADSTPYLWAFVVVPVLVACLHPRVLNPLLDRLLKLARRPGLEHPLSGRALSAALAWCFVAWLFNGLQIWLLTSRVGAPLGTAALLAIGGFAFAWSVGFLVIFAPAGVGVREVLLVTLLTPAVGAGAATAVALVSRVVTTASDLLLAGAAAARRRPSAPPAPAAPPNPDTRADPGAPSAPGAPGAPPDDGPLSDPISHNASGRGAGTDLGR